MPLGLFIGLCIGVVIGFFIASWMSVASDADDVIETREMRAFEQRINSNRECAPDAWAEWT